MSMQLRELKDLLASGNVEQAAIVASQRVAQDPGNAALNALAMEALLKANLPPWIAALKARQFDRATEILANMKKLGGQNAAMQPLLNELEWIGDLEQFVSARGGADVAEKDGTDAEKIKRLVKQWDDDSQLHQRAFSTIVSYAPEFRDAYAQALSHLRKLAQLGGSNGKQPESP